MLFLISTREGERETCIRFCTNLTTHVKRPSVRMCNDVLISGGCSRKTKIAFCFLCFRGKGFVFLSFVLAAHVWIPGQDSHSCMRPAYSRMDRVFGLMRGSDFLFLGLVFMAHHLSSGAMGLRQSRAIPVSFLRLSE